MADKRSRSSGWGLFLLFWTMLLLLLGFLVCVVFYKYTAVYEQTRPERTMDALMAEMSEDDWRETLAATAGGVSEYEDARALFNDYFDSTVKGNKLSYRRDISRSDETQTVFVLYAGAARIGEIRLLPYETAERFSFGRKEWKLESITSETLSDSLQALTVQIDAPDGVTPYLNGTAVGQEKIVDPAVALTQHRGERSRRERDRSRGRAGGRRAALCDHALDDLFLPRGSAGGRQGLRLRRGAGRGAGPQPGTDHVPRPERLSAGGRLRHAALRDGRSVYRTADPRFVQRRRAHARDRRGREIHLLLSRRRRHLHRDALYTSDKYNGVALKNVRDRILPGTELDSYFSHSYDAMIWASATEMDQKELRFGNFHRVGDKCFTCTILYKADFTATQWYGKDSYAREDGYKMVFLRGEEGQWLAATMSAFE